MDFEFTEEQESIRGLAREILGSEVSSELLKRVEAEAAGFDANLWSKLAEANLLGRWWLGGDYQIQTFGEFEGPQEWLGEGMEDETTISVGVEKRIAYQRHGGLDNWPLRMGFRTRQWAYQVGGNPVRENTYSIGTGFPFRGKLGVLDLALSYSTIGDLEENGLEDSIWKMSLSVTGLENWW